MRIMVKLLLLCLHCGRFYAYDLTEGDPRCTCGESDPHNFLTLDD